MLIGHRLNTLDAMDCQFSGRNGSLLRCEMYIPAKGYAQPKE